MAGNKLWSLQEDQLIDNAILIFPHRTSIEISAVLFGHPLLKSRTSSGLLQHVEQRREKVQKIKSKTKVMVEAKESTGRMKPKMASGRR